MSFKLEEETGSESHKIMLRDQIQSLKDHWHNVQRQSNDWLTQINLMWDLWRQYEQLKSELEAWMTKAEERLTKAERASGNTVAELEDLLQEHKVRLLILEAAQDGRHSMLHGQWRLFDNWNILSITSRCLHIMYTPSRFCFHDSHNIWQRNKFLTFYTFWETLLPKVFAEIEGKKYPQVGQSLLIN